MKRSSDDSSNQTKAGGVFSTVFITGICFVERVEKKSVCLKDYRKVK